MKKVKKKKIEEKINPADLFTGFPNIQSEILEELKAIKNILLGMIEIKEKEKEPHGK